VVEQEGKIRKKKDQPRKNRKKRVGGGNTGKTIRELWGRFLTTSRGKGGPPSKNEKGGDSRVAGTLYAMKKVKNNQKEAATGN